MFFSANNLLIQLILSLVLSVPGVNGLLQGQNLEAVEQNYQQALGQRARLMDELESLETQYRDIVGRIEELKRQGAMESIAGRLELESLLRKSKSVSDRLGKLQTRVRRIDNRITAQRSQLVGGIDARIHEMERALVKASASERKKIVQKLNALRRERGGYTASLPAVPDPEDVSATLSLADEADQSHPEEMLAAADELQDTEDQLRRRLSAIEGRLQELRESRQLMRRARSFSREERFFEETDRNRVIAQYDKKETARVDSDRDTSGQPRANEGVSGGVSANNGGAPTDDTANAGDAFTGGGEADPAPASDADGSAERQGEAVDNSPGAAPAAKEEPAPGYQSDDPFQQTQETVVIDSGSDPSRSIGAAPLGETNVDSQIRTLEEERERLEEQAEKLESRANELRTQAGAVD